jgi:hypothetical protein
MHYFFYVLFILLFVPVVKQEYNKDPGYNKSAKIFNLIISFLLLFLFSNQTKRELMWAFDEINIAEKVFIEYGILSPFLNALSWVLFVIFSFYLTILIIQIALRKEKSRLIFLKVLPIYCVLYSINSYRYLISKYTEVSNSYSLLPFIFVINSFIVVFVIYFYTRNFMKKFFQFGESEKNSNNQNDFNQVTAEPEVNLKGHPNA